MQEEQLTLPAFAGVSMVPGFFVCSRNLPQQAVENATVAVAEEAGIWAPGKPGRSLQKWILDAHPGRPMQQPSVGGSPWFGVGRGGCDVGCDGICC